jgi:hypothetical protein
VGLGRSPIEVAPDRLFVELSADALPGAATDEALRAAGACASAELEIEPADSGVVVRVRGGAPLEEIAAVLAGVPGVRGVRFDPLVRGAGATPSAWHLAALRIGKALKKQPSAAGVVVALLDTGLSTDAGGAPLAPGLEGTPIAAGHDFVNGDADPADDNGHGTMLASIVASAGDYPGVAPGVTLLPIKVLDHERVGTESMLTAGITLATDKGADVISMSLAFPPGFVPSADLSTALRRAAAAGAVLVGASGNAGVGEVAYPAAHGDVVAVGGGRLVKKHKALSVKKALKFGGRAVARKMGRAEYSSWGAPLDLLAPGGSMSHDLDGDGFPDAIPTVGPASGGGFEGVLLAGTSPATALSAGVMALLRAAGAAPGDMRQNLYQGATDLKPDGFDTASGAGVLDAFESMKFQKTGKKLVAAPARFVNPVVTLANDGDGARRAIALIEVVDAAGAPVSGVTVLGHFRGPVVHDVSAVTDAEGRALVASLPAPAGSQLFELGVDKIVELVCPDHDDDGKGKGKDKGKDKDKDGDKDKDDKDKDDKDDKDKDKDDDDDDGCDEDDLVEIVTVPRELSRFELATFRFVAAFRADGAGLDPSPWSVLTPPEFVQPFVATFAGGMVRGPDPSPPVLAPVTTIPTDVESWTLVESLQVRSFGPAAGGGAPTVMVVDRAVLGSNCQVAERVIPVRSRGVGLDPSPWRIDDSMLADPITTDQVTLRSESIQLNGSPTTEADLGLLFGDKGRVLVTIDGSPCVPQRFVFTDLGLLSQDVLQNQPVDDGGFRVSRDTTTQSTQETGVVALGDTAVGAAVGQAPFASGIGTKAAAAAGP